MDFFKKRVIVFGGLERIYKHYGEDHQLAKMIEECEELIEAIKDFRQSKTDANRKHLIEELADVRNVSWQLEGEFLNFWERWEMDSIGARKILRQLDRIDEEIANAKK